MAVSAATLSGQTAPHPTLAEALIQINAASLNEWDAVHEQLADDLPAGVAAVWAMELGATPSTTGDHFLPAVVERWAEDDGPGAFKFARDHATSARFKLITAAGTGWARREPWAAWAALRAASSDFNDLRVGVVGAFNALCESDLPGALEAYLAMPAHRQCLSCLGGNLTIIAHKSGGLPVVRDFIEALPPSPHRSALRDTYWRLQGQERQIDAFKEAAETSDPAETLAVQTAFLRGFAAGDVAGALDLALEVDTAHSEAVAAVINTWAGFAEAGEVAEIIAELPAHLSDRSLAGVATALARINPAAIADWCLAFHSEELRYNALQEVIRNWAWLDEVEARRFIENQTSLELKGRLVWSFVFSRVDHHAFDLADLTLLEDSYNRAWKVNLLSRLAVALADPKTRAASFITAADFIGYIRDLEEFDDTEKKRIISPFGADAV